MKKNQLIFIFKSGVMMLPRFMFFLEQVNRDSLAAGGYDIFVCRYSPPGN